MERDATRRKNTGRAERVGEGARMRMAEPQDGGKVERERERETERVYVCAKERRRERGTTAWSSKRQSSIPHRGAPVYPAICI